MTDSGDRSPARQSPPTTLGGGARETQLRGPLLLSRGAVDRAAALRADPDALDRAWADRRTRVLVVRDGRTLAVEDGSRLALLSTEEAPEGPRYLLGVDDEGTAYFAVASEPPKLEGTRAAGLRQVGGALGDRDAGLMVQAVALEAWHSTHRYCPACGSATEPAQGGHVRVCTDDGRQHFPRVDPAVIMLVHSGTGDEERCLLGRGTSWPEGRFSVLAGFVEPGESLEHAVAREVAEEVGVQVTGARYLGSQPWPFPRSLMLGFFARAVSMGLSPDPEEIAEARWFTRRELADATGSGEIGLPGELSIARRLIETWYGGPLAGSWP